MKRKRSGWVLAYGALAASLGLATAASAQQTGAAPAEPGRQTDSPVGPEAPVTFPKAADLQEGFGQQTPPGDPFGANMQSAMPMGFLHRAVGTRMGPWVITPAIAAGLKYDDNIFSAQTNKKGSVGSVVSGLVSAENKLPNGHSIDATYAVDANQVHSSKNDSFVTHRAVAGMHLIGNNRLRIDMRAAYTSSVDPRGSTSRPSGSEPDEWHSTEFSGVVSYGAPGAKGRLEVEGGYQEKRYDNNRTFTVVADRNTSFYGAAFFWRVMPKTSVLAQVRRTELDYATSTSLLDSSETRYLVGVTWDATAKTTGIVRAGLLKKEFNSIGGQDYTGFTASAAVTWRPLTYSVYSLTASQETSETTGVGLYSLSRSLIGTWQHSWTGKLMSNVSLGYRQDDFRGLGATREDNLYSGGAGLTYQMRRWLSFGAQYQHIERRTNATGFDYGKNVYMLQAGATL